MQIIHFHPDIRMADIFISPLLSAERNAGYENELITSVFRPGKFSKIIPFDLSVSNLFGLPTAIWKIWRYLSQTQPNVVICHNTKSAVIPLFAAWLSGVPVRVYFNHGVPYIGYQGFFRWVLRLLESWNCVLATHVLTVSQSMVKLLEDVSPKSNPIVINNGSASGIDINAFSAEKFDRSSSRQSLGLRESDLVIVYVGRPERRKGFELVLNLWSKYISEDHIKLVLCGPTETDICKYLGTVPNNVKALGFVDNVSEVLSVSELMILPSLHEGLSYACIEAQAVGAVVIANDINGMSCIIENGYSGFLVKNNEQKKYLEIIRHVDSERSFIDNIRKQARRNVAKFSREEFLPSYLSFIKSITSY